MSAEKDLPFSAEERKQIRMILKDRANNLWFFERMATIGRVSKAVIMFIMACAAFWAWGIEAIKHVLGIAK